MASANRSEIDYFPLTHFHEDHLGEVILGNFELSPLSKYGNYQLSGLTDVAETIKIKTIIDRDHPHYNYPVPLTAPVVRNYRAFLNSFVQRGGNVERIIPGSNRQVVLRRSPQEFPTFDVRNLAVNGEVWTGVADQTPPLFSGSLVVTEGAISVGEQMLTWGPIELREIRLLLWRRHGT